jgi:uncharacterized membrane protein
MLPRAQVRELDMTVDEALKYIISMGVVAPRLHPGTHPALDDAVGPSGNTASPATRAESALRN